MHASPHPTPIVSCRLQQFAAGLLTALFTASGLAASIADRSPFAQGHWWDPSRSGSGFEIFSGGEEVAVLWFTYDESARPVWYLAKGKLATVGMEAWPLQMHTWVNGRHGEPRTVGSLRFNVHHPEAAEVVWQLGTASGTLDIKPFVMSGIINEVDHGGAWFDPTRSGWGITLAEQGDILAGALYTYDPAGKPVWYAGYDLGTAGLNLAMYSGACPACARRDTTSRQVGRLNFSFGSETQLTLQGTLAEPVAAGAHVDQAALVQFSRPASARTADRQLASFTTDAALKRHLDTGILNLRIQPIIQFSASPSPGGVAFSTTNLQESGVDEADVIKTDGTFIYTYRHDAQGNRYPALRVAKVTDGGASFALQGEVALSGGSSSRMGTAGLYVHDKHLISITGTVPYSYGGPAWTNVAAWQRGVTHVEVLDTRQSALPATVWHAEIDGHLVSSRRVGDRLYLISRHVPSVAGLSSGATTAAQIAANQDLLARTPLADILPKVRINAGQAQPLVQAADVFAPPLGARRIEADLMVVTVVDLAQPRIRQSLAIVGSIDTVYASSSSLYLVGSRNEIRSASTAMPIAAAYTYLTDVHQIRFDNDALRVAGSATVEGYVDGSRNSAALRLSEHEGRLRMVTTSMGMWGSTSLNRLTLLERSNVAPGLLKTVAYLPNPRRPEPLGKPGEMLYGTRFVGDRLYAVTFKKVDPLYIVDLADSRDPRITGALEVPGFSDYLHPLPNGLLLGFGKDARPAGGVADGQFAWFQGLQLSLFDVSDAGKPVELQRLLMGKRGSQSALLESHHAFSSVRQSDGSLAIGIPARIHDGALPPYSSDWTEYPWDHSGLLRFELRGNQPANAQLVPLPGLLTHRSTQPTPGFVDAAAREGRSVLFALGTVYVSAGGFWHQDRAGQITGPH